MSSVKVAVRVRPMNTKELLSATVSNVVQLDGNEVVVFAGNTADNTAGVHHRYMYDSTFWSCNSEHRNYCGQEEVYNELARPLLDRAFEGYNTCLFAYGQTSSGKSYSMMGIDAGAGERINCYCKLSRVYCDLWEGWVIVDWEKRRAVGYGGGYKSLIARKGCRNSWNMKGCSFGNKMLWIYFDPQ